MSPQLRLYPVHKNFSVSQVHINLLVSKEQIVKGVPNDKEKAFSQRGRLVQNLLYKHIKKQKTVYMGDKKKTEFCPTTNMTKIEKKTRDFSGI